MPAATPPLPDYRGLADDGFHHDDPGFADRVRESAADDDPGLRMPGDRIGFHDRYVAVYHPGLRVVAAEAVHPPADPGEGESCDTAPRYDHVPEAEEPYHDLPPLRERSIRAAI
jgi:hypothetical protein